MTSKEKLESIKKCILNWDEKEIKWFDDILKDLEILEILKNLAKGVIDLKNNNIDITKYVVLISESTNEKVKNWLERKE